ncbi:MAG: tetratricopeptide repeat protein [Cyanobacteria bacterium SZAS TMP-1]|nr:tetratricopeptide repeat protein [Cyanobacteria bacterium SZAS TMP-1]
MTISGLQLASLTLALTLSVSTPALATKLNARPLPHAGAVPGATGQNADVNQWGRPVKDFSQSPQEVMPPSQWKARKSDYRDIEKQQKEEAAAKEKAAADSVKKAKEDQINAIRQYQTIAIEANNKAVALGRQGHLTEAIAQHELACKYDPGNKQFKINLSAAEVLYGQKLLAQKDYAGAANMFRKGLAIVPDNGQAGKYLNEAIQRMGLDPSLSDNRLGIGDELAASGDIGGANVEYQQAMRLDPSARTYTKMGDMAMRYGNVGNAMSWYRQAVVKDPDYGPAHRQLGNVMLAMKDMTGAAAELRKAVILDPKDTAAGQSLIEIWRRQVALNPLLAENHMGLGAAMQLTGDFSTAENEYSQAERLDPRNGSVAAARASLQRAVKHTAAEKHKQATETFFNQGLYRDALSEIGQAVMIEPRNEKYQFLLGQCLEKMGDLQGARQAFHTCVLLSPQNEEAASHLRDIENGLTQGGGNRAQAPRPEGLSRPGSEGSQAGQQYGGMGIGSAQASTQGVMQGPGQSGGASGREKNMFEGNPQTDGGRAVPPAGGVNRAPATAMPPQNQAAAAPTIDPQTQATLTAAENLENQRDYQGAANLLKQSLSANLQNGEIHHRLAVNLLNLGQLEEAVSEFRIASALSPTSKVFAEDYARALKIHKKALSADSLNQGGAPQTTGAVGDLK